MGVERCEEPLRSHPRMASVCLGYNFGVIERGVPQAYVRARASSATLCSGHVLRVFLCIFYIKKGIWYVSKRAWIHIWYASKPVPPCHGTPLMIILTVRAQDGWNGQSTVDGSKWTKTRMLKSGSGYFGHSTKMVVWTILGHFGPAHFPTVPAFSKSWHAWNYYFRII